MTKTEISTAFERAFSQRPALLAHAPGRVNLLGEHVDYNQGLALPCAIQFAAHVAVAENTTGDIRLAALDLGAERTLAVDDLRAAPDQLGGATPEWARLPVGVCWAWLRSGRPLAGFDAAYTCDVPQGSGLSSSAAIEVGFATALARLHKINLPGLESAELCQLAEHHIVGVQSGLMDQWTSACAVVGHALRMDFQARSVRPVPIPAGSAIVVADTGVRRALAGSAYNQRVEACRQAVVELSDLQPGVESLRDISPESFAQLADRLSPSARRHAQHVVDEIERVRRGVDCLEAGDLAGFGDLMRASHASLRDLYQVSGPELDLLAAIGDRLRGGYGTRLTGAGFGGSTVSLVDASQAVQFCNQLTERYHSETGRRAETWICQATGGAWAETG